MNNLKAGFLSSEFWVTVASFLVNLLVMLGVLTPVEADDFVKSVATAFAALTTIVITLMYIYSRMVLKKASIENSAPAVQVLNGGTVVTPRGDVVGSTGGTIVVPQ